MGTSEPFSDLVDTSREDGRPRLDGRFGSLDAFWRLIEPVLTHLEPSRICEIGVEKGIFTARLLAWGEENHCAYVGIDPAPHAAAADRIQTPPAGRDRLAVDRLLTARSVEVLPELERCDVYFLDGDHNYHTVRSELELIQRARGLPAENIRGPVIFAHDVSWPFARRDMYHQPASIPPEGLHPYSEDLGVSLESGELIAGGLRAPGQYSIAHHAGGPRNGVLTAIEDFLASDAGRGWQSIVVPIAYGLAVLYRPDDAALPRRCADYLHQLRAAVGVTGKFLESCEANFLQLYLYSEHAKYQLAEQGGTLQLERGAHHDTLEAYRAMESGYHDLDNMHKTLAGDYQALESEYRQAAVYNEGLTREFDRLHGAYASLENEYKTLLQHCDVLQNYIDGLPPSPIPPQRAGTVPQSTSGAVLTGSRAED